MSAEQSGSECRAGQRVMQEREGQGRAVLGWAGLKAVLWKGRSGLRAVGWAGKGRAGQV
jgi:hypothetical protein